MTTNRKTAIAVGVLFFIATASYLTGSQMITSAVSAPDFLANLNGGQVRTGVLLELVNAAAVVGIAVLLFPVLKKYSESMAMGYTASRVLESALLLISALCALALLPLAEGAAGAGAAQLQSMADASMDWYNLSFQMAMVALGTGSLALCYVLYRAKLVPRALAALGVIGYLALLISALLGFYGYNAAVLFAPGAVFEIIFPLWLIVKGFSGPARVAKSA